MNKHIVRLTVILFLLLMSSGCTYEGSYTSSSSEGGTVSSILKEAEKQRTAIEESQLPKSDEPGIEIESTPAPDPGEEEIPSSDNAPDNESEYEPTYEEVIVSDHIDGDTIYVTYPNGKKKKLRLIGIDTPETINEVEYYGKEASDYTKEHLLGEIVYLQKDVSETDQFDRLLRYVWLSVPEDPEGQAADNMFNAILVKNGFAEAKSYPPDTRYMDIFYDLQELAKAAEKGMWSSESNNK